jgi:hypothetical protein
MQAEERAERPTSGNSSAFFWDLLKPEKRTLVEIFDKEGDLDRSGLYEGLLGKTQGVHEFKDWLPDKIRLGFSAAFERDAYLQLRSRTETFAISASGCRRRGEAAGEMIDALKRVSES